MNGGDNSFTAGVISASTLVLVNWLVGSLTAKNKWLEGIIEERPRILVNDGHIKQDVMSEEKITCHELMAALRAEGCANLKDVHFAVLENNGSISVVPYKENREDRHADSLPIHV